MKNGLYSELIEILFSIPMQILTVGEYGALIRIANPDHPNEHSDFDRLIGRLRQYPDLKETVIGLEKLIEKLS